MSRGGGGGGGLNSYYASADAFVLVRRPHPYLEFAMPIKIFEAIGHGLPLIANEGSLAAKFIHTENIGWVVRDALDLRRFLLHLLAHPGELGDKLKSVRLSQEHHSWVARARQVARTLSCRAF